MTDERLATPAQPTYVLGHSEHELARLEEQSLFYRGHTLRFLGDAGLSPGDRVLDIGCGVGDVSFAAAELVGPAGSVLGVDRAPPAIATARSRAAAANVGNVSFSELDIVEETSLPAAGDMFDAVVGRFVLMYTSDPVAVLRQLRARVRPGGLLAFLEMDMSLSRSWPRAPTAEQCGAWIRETFARARIETDPGLKLYSWFVAAGLAPHFAGAFARVEGGPDSPAYVYLANTV